MRKISLTDHGAIHCGKGVTQAKGGRRKVGSWCRTYCNLDDNWNGKENEWNVLTMMTMRPTTATTRLTPPAHLPPPTTRTYVLLQVLPSLSLSTRLSSCRSVLPPPPVPCCQHVLLLRRLFALKILFIAIARICTKIFYNAGQQHRDGWGVGRGGMPGRG